MDSYVIINCLIQYHVYDNHSVSVTGCYNHYDYSVYVESCSTDKKSINTMTVWN